MQLDAGVGTRAAACANDVNATRIFATAGLVTMALSGAPSTGEKVSLPSVQPSGMSLDEAIRRRRSVRELSSRALSVEEIGHLCWSAQGVTDTARGLRAAPSAGALHPLEIYVVSASGVFHYEPREHRLERRATGDARDALAHAAFDQDVVRRAGVDLVLTAVVGRTRAKYGDRAERFAHLEAGHAAQNVLLEATALGLGAVPVGAFDDAAVRRALRASSDETPLYILAAGHLQ